MDIESEKTVRLSLGWIIAGLIFIVLAGMAGGAVIQQIFPPAQPLNPASDQLVTTVQEVTISPNKAASEITGRVQRSIVLLGSATGVEATGVIATNDGVIVTPAVLGSVAPTAYDEQGLPLALNIVGRDEVFGLTYYRLSGGVFPAMDVRQDEALVAQEFLNISRSKTTFQPRVLPWRLQEYVLPAPDNAPGVQRFLRGTGIGDPLLVGSPLLDDEGRLSGIVTDPENGLALSAGELRASLNRVAGQKREFNPLKELGMSVKYVFKHPNDTTPIQFALEITAVAPTLPAQRSGLHANDVITEIDGRPLAWNTNPATTLSKNLPIALTFWRDGQKQTITVSSSAP